MARGTISLKVKGDQELQRQFAEIAKTKFRQKAYLRLRKFTDMVRGEAKRRAPVDTGRLCFSIKARTWEESLTGAVYADYPAKGARLKAPSYYAFALEYGTYKMKAQPFLAPALAAKQRLLKAEMEAAIEEALKE